jgi:hypothetical protein
MKNLNFFMSLGIMSGVLLLQSCSEDVVPPERPQEELKIETNASMLDHRINNTMAYVDLVGTAGGRIADFTLVQVSEVIPPVEAGRILTASSIDLKNDHVAVGYNTPGAEFYGGIDLLKRNGESLDFVSSIVLNQSDVNMVNFENNELYWVGGSPTSDSVAFVDKIRLRSNLPDEDTYQRARIGGHMSTCIQRSGSELFVTSGDEILNGGGLHTIDKNSLESTSYKEIKDARWVEITRDYILVLGATPGKLYVYSTESMELQNTIDVEGLIYAGTKATLDVYKDHVYIASAYQGVNIYNLATGEFKANIPLPTDQASPEMIVNSVTIDSNKGFIACGEAVFMFQVRNAQTDPEPTVVGRLDLGNYQSINHVRFRSGYLFIASGKGGAKLIKVSS